jgi:prepilin-type N-terminal cleavage/methylation domain-containing protein
MSRRNRSAVRGGVHRLAGFTLIELIVVLAIIGLAATVVAPAFRRLTGDARTTTDAITTLYAGASRAAHVRRVPVTVVIEVATGRFTTITEPAPGTPRDTIESGALVLAADARLTGGRDGWALVSFDPHGGARGSTIGIIQEHGSYDIQVDPWTAEPLVHRR